MKDRAESLTCFKHFKTMNENLFSAKIKLFQCDGAYELVKGMFKQYLDQEGITVSCSCPHTSQQNGLAERKHQHIASAGNTLSFQACLQSPSGLIPLWLPLILLTGLHINF